MSFSPDRRRGDIPDQTTLKNKLQTAKNTDELGELYSQITDQSFLQDQIIAVTKGFDWDLFNNPDLMIRKEYRESILPVSEGLRNISNQEFIVDLILEIECPIEFKIAAIRQLRSEKHLHSIIEDITTGSKLRQYSLRAYEKSLSPEKMIPDFLSFMIFLATQRMENKDPVWELLQNSPDLFSPQLKNLYIRDNDDFVFAIHELELPYEEEKENLYRYILRTFEFSPDRLKRVLHQVDPDLYPLVLTRMDAKTLAEIRLTEESSLGRLIGNIHEIGSFEDDGFSLDEIGGQWLCDLISYHPDLDTRLRLIETNFPDLSHHDDYPPSDGDPIFSQIQFEQVYEVIENDPSMEIRTGLMRKLPKKHLNYLEFVDLEMENFRDELYLG